MTVVVLLFRPSPTPLHAWRRLLLRLFGAKIGAGVVVYPSAKIWAPWNLTVESGATIGWKTELYCVAPINIGRLAIVSQHSHLCTATHDHNNDFQLQTAAIVVGPDAWIAAEAFVGPGVQLGRGAVAAARAVVVRDVEAWDIVGGNPARVISRRDSKARNLLHLRG